MAIFTLAAAGGPGKKSREVRSQRVRTGRNERRLWFSWDFSLQGARGSTAKKGPGHFLRINHGSANRKRTMKIAATSPLEIKGLWPFFKKYQKKRIIDGILKLLN